MQTEVAISTAGLLDISLFPSLVSLWPAALSKTQSLQRLGDAAAGPDGLSRLMSEAPATTALTVHNHTGSSIMHWLGGPNDAAAPATGESMIMKPLLKQGSCLDCAGSPRLAVLCLYAASKPDSAQGLSACSEWLWIGVSCMPCHAHPSQRVYVHHVCCSSCSIMLQGRQQPSALRHLAPFTGQILPRCQGRTPLPLPRQAQLICARLPAPMLTRIQSGKKVRE